jgi:hypothetical protein
MSTVVEKIFFGFAIILFEIPSRDFMSTVVEKIFFGFVIILFEIPSKKIRNIGGHFSTPSLPSPLPHVGEGLGERARQAHGSLNRKRSRRCSCR